MPEVTLTGQVRSRSSSRGSDAQRNATKVRIPDSVGEPDPMTINSEEQNGLNVPAKRRQHPAQLRKSVLLALADDTDNNEVPKSPRRGSMLRRFSRAASFKKAREHLPVNIDLKGILHRFERHSTIHGICHASLAPNKRWRRFWLSVFALCLIILIIQVIYTAIKFLKYPKTVDLDLKFENAPFPSVTICNLNPYKASAIRNDIAAKATMDALENVLQETGRSEGVAAAISPDNVKKVRRELNSQHQPRKQEQQLTADPPTTATSSAGTTDWREMALAIHRRYLQVYATCYCEVNRLSSVRRRGSCYAAYKNRVTVRFLENSTEKETHMHYFYPTKCLCQLDWMAKAIWPCFPYNTWKEHICVECVDDHGHCPMRFLDYRTSTNDGASNKKAHGNKRPHPLWSRSSHGLYAIETLDENMDICVCHREYNHCVANNMDGEIPEIMPGDDLNLLNISHLTEGVRRRGEVSQAVIMALKAYERSENANGTNDNEQQRESIEQAMGFEELHDEIAIKVQARENLMFAVEEKPMDERVRLSQAKDELILKCSFNQHDCDIEKDFKLFHDPTYGNCYTFNWDRNDQVTAHRAGANYGLRVLVYANVSEYLPITEAVGFRITVHDKLTVPFVDAFGYNAPTGTLSAFGVRMKKFFRLEHPYGHCREGGELAEWYIYNSRNENYNYSIEGCHRSCTQREVVRVCGCADPMFPVPPSAVRCRMSDPEARNCLKNTTRQLSQLIADGALEGCQCPLPCYETGYEVTYSAANWPSGTTKLMECESNDALCMEKYRINAAMIQVFYEELNYQTLTESPAYSVTSLIADLGGLSGLWIGISVVSILEVVQLIWFCMQYIHKKKTPELLAMVRNARQRSTTAGRADKSSSSSPSIRARTESVGAYSLKSLHSVRSELRPGIRITQERRQSHSTGSSTPYLAPEVELPCTCLYGARGQIVFMKPLCPFHGYMVRRIMRAHSDDEEEEEGEDNFDEEPADEEEAELELDNAGKPLEQRTTDAESSLLNAEEMKALARETNLEHQQQTMAQPQADTLPKTPHGNGTSHPPPTAGAIQRASTRRGTVKSSRKSSSSSTGDRPSEVGRKRTVEEKM